MKKISHSPFFLLLSRRFFCVMAGLFPVILSGEPSEAAESETSGLQATQWASESMLGSPVAITFDNLGRAYVTQTVRRRDSDLDIRNYRDWVTDELSFRTVEDRRAFIRRVFDASRSEQNQGRLTDHNNDGIIDWRDLMVQGEIIHRIEDTTGDGVADRSSVFAEDFRTEITGVAGGILWHDDALFVTISPDVWRLLDATGDGRSDFRESITHGYGVQMGFAGHGMSGMTVGYDGRIYWSVGDIGLHVTTEDGREFPFPGQGAVMRSNPDGSDFEVFAYGLRNTHEIAFDEYGNLFSVDNDGDMPGERERFVYITEGSDTGWRVNWQHRGGGYNPWMDEDLFRPQFDGQAAYITPALSNYSNGPSGFAYNPGTALNERYRGYFFLTQFPTGDLRAFKVKSKGAYFEMLDEHRVHEGILAPGLAFGPDGALYLTDWIEGWVPHDRGRVWKLDDPDQADSRLRSETAALLAEGMRERMAEDLASLLEHPDMRVRRNAQFELAERDERELLREIALDQHRPELARVHAIWGLGQIGRAGDFSGNGIISTLLGDADPEIRAQTARLAGDIRYTAGVESLLPLLTDSSPRTRFFAGIALGNIGAPEAFEPLVSMLEENDNTDPYLRHAGIMGLAGVGDTGLLGRLAGHPQASVRIAAVVALRRMEDPEVAHFLEDQDEWVIAEAARAIHDDFSIPAALPLLSEILERKDLTDEALLRRAISANFRVGGEENAKRLVRYASRPSAPLPMRVEALEALAQWQEPPVLDRVEGRYRPLPARDVAVIRAALEEQGDVLLESDVDAYLAAVVRLASAVEYPRWSETFLGWIENRNVGASVRRAALNALEQLGDVNLATAVAAGLEDPDESVRGEAGNLLGQVEWSGGSAVELFAAVLKEDSTSVGEKQRALRALGNLEDAEADEVLAGWMDRLLDGEVPPELQLDLLEAAKERSSEAMVSRLEQYEASLLSADPLAEWEPALAGGNAALGRTVFMEHIAAQCIRCHNIGGDQAEAVIAPDLAGVGARKTPREMLRSLVDPNAEVTPGYGRLSLVLSDGTTVSGILDDETATSLTVRTAEGPPVTVRKDQIEERGPVISAMPPMGYLLTKEEMRDVIEFLGTLE